ncbi:hypothetical protein GCM10020220_006260 [Nonomuraea rubra]
MDLALDGALGASLDGALAEPLDGNRGTAGRGTGGTPGTDPAHGYFRICHELGPVRVIPTRPDDE